MNCRGGGRPPECIHADASRAGKPCPYKKTTNKTIHRYSFLIINCHYYEISALLHTPQGMQVNAGCGSPSARNFVRYCLGQRRQLPHRD